MVFGARSHSLLLLLSSICVIFVLEVEGSVPRGQEVNCERSNNEQPPSSATVIWEELVEDDKPSGVDSSKRAMPGQPKRGIRLLNPSSWWFQSVKEKRADPREPPHPLRTNLWELSCRWRGPASKKSSGVYNCSKFVLEFDPTGYVRVRPSDPSRPGGGSGGDGDWIAVGKWKLETAASFTFTIPLPVEQASKGEETAVKQHVFEMDFHSNPFGPQPKFTRGVVFRENGGWLRPVVATFTGKGIGKDTADLSYRKRKLPK